jgi:hypothetical protein
MNERYGDYRGMQGKCYRIWKTKNGYEVEMVWGGNGVIFTADNVRECKQYLKKECRAKRIVH